MHSEQDAARRTDRRTGRWRTAVVLSVLVLAGCGAGAALGAAPRTAPSRRRSTALSGPARRIPRTPLRPSAAPAREPACPTSSSAARSADDPQGVGSWTIAFAADGRYAQSNPLRGVTVGGQAAVAGRKLYLQPEDADSQTFVWQVTGEGLRLDDHAYRRTAGARGAA